MVLQTEERFYEFKELKELIDVGNIKILCEQLIAYIHVNAILHIKDVSRNSPNKNQEQPVRLNGFIELNYFKSIGFLLRVEPLGYCSINGKNEPTLKEFLVLNNEELTSVVNSREDLGADPPIGLHSPHQIQQRNKGAISQLAYKKLGGVFNFYFSESGLIKKCKEFGINAALADSCKPKTKHSQGLPIDPIKQPHIANESNTKLTVNQKLENALKLVQRKNDNHKLLNSILTSMNNHNHLIKDDKSADDIIDYLVSDKEISLLYEYQPPDILLSNGRSLNENNFKRAVKRLIKQS